MPIGQHQVQPLFATPIFRADLGPSITPEQIAYVQGLKMILNRDNFISEDLYIFNHPELAQLAAGVQEALDVYAREVMGTDAKLYVTQSWALENPPNVGMHAHSHSNSIISGSLYYAPLPTPTAKMVFEKHAMYRQLEINPARELQNIYNTPINVIEPKQNEMLLFPSELNHMIEPNLSSETRYAIAFNCFIKGHLGDYRDVSELTL